MHVSGFSSNDLVAEAQGIHPNVIISLK